MNKHQTKIIGFVALLSVLLIVAILWLPTSTDRTAASQSDSIEEPVKGPHGGRLLESGDGFQLEATIFETGVPPEFRFYPFLNDEPVDPARLAISATVHRLGGVVDHINFSQLGDFLLGDMRAYEPHSFEVKIEGTFDGVPVSWAYETTEGRVTLTEEVAFANGVILDKVRSQIITSTIDLPGEIRFDEEKVARIAPRIAGTVVEVRVGLGDKVNAGDILAVIESRELGGAVSNYIESLHRLELAQSTYGRERFLLEKGITARKEYEKVRHNLEEAELQKQLTEQVLLTLGFLPEQMNALGIEPEGVADGREVRTPLEISLTQYFIRAPFQGEVIDRRLSVGQAVSGTDEVFTIADLSSVWVEIFVYAHDVSKLKIGQKVIVSAITDETNVSTGTIRFVGSLTGTSSRTAKALVTLKNNGRWRPGMLTRAVIKLGDQSVPMAISREAIQSWREMSIVFARFDSAFEVRPVVLGLSDDEWVEVLSGLDMGQKIASTGAYLLKAELEKSGASHDH